MTEMKEDKLYIIKPILIFIIAIVSVILIILFSMKGAENKAISLEENVESTNADIDTQLERRVNVFTELSECVKEYDSHEYNTLMNVIAERGSDDTDTNVTKDIVTEVKAVAEAYPELKSQGNYSQLMTEISITENLIQRYRETYNSQVKSYKRYVRKFPSKQFLDMSGYEVQNYEYYKTEAQSSGPVDIFN